MTVLRIAACNHWDKPAYGPDDHFGLSRLAVQRLTSQLQSSGHQRCRYIEKGI